MSGVRYSTATIARARALREEHPQMSLAAIARQLGTAHQTVHRWLDPDYDAHRAAYTARATRRLRAKRRLGAGAFVPEMVALRNEGMPYGHIAAAIRVLIGQSCAGETVRNLLHDHPAVTYRAKPRGVPFTGGAA
jgi:peptidoglycan/xylan/chitin deacetylase (PgdA/CDA1 family)